MPARQRCQGQQALLAGQRVTRGCTGASADATWDRVGRRQFLEVIVSSIEATSRFPTEVPVRHQTAETRSSTRAACAFVPPLWRSARDAAGDACSSAATSTTRPRTD